MKKPKQDELLAEVRVIANEVQHLKAAQSEIMREVRHIKGSVLVAALSQAGLYDSSVRRLFKVRKDTRLLEMTLSEKQRLFSKLIAQLILKAYDMGYEIACGEFYRTPEQAALNAQKGTGVADSQHTKCLAADLNLFKGGVYLTKTEDHAALGAYWKTLDPLCRWGGDFQKKDGNHYEVY